MSNGSTSTLPDVAPSPESYTLRDWITILHNGAQVGPEHPQYPQVRQLMSQALARVAQMHTEQNAADQQALRISPALSFAENMAQSMSLGLGGLKNPEVQDFLSQSRQDNPGSSLAGGMAGNAVPTTILSLLGVPPNVAMGATAGMQAGVERGPLAGAGAGIAGLVGGKLISTAATKLGLPQAAQVVSGGVQKLLGRGAAGAAAAGEEMIGNMTASQVRSALEKKGFTGEALERMVDRARASLAPQGVVEAASPVRTQSGGVSTTLPIDQTAQIPAVRAAARSTMDTPTFQRNAAQSIEEVQDRLAQARAGVPRRAPTIPQPSGGVSVTGRTATPSDVGPFSASRQLSGAVADAEERLGRSLTSVEREAVLTNQLQRLSRGQTLPYYPRGGQVEQALTPSPQVSPSQAIQQTVTDADATGLRRIIAAQGSPTALVNAAKQELASRLAALQR